MTPMLRELHEARKARLQRMKAWHRNNVVPLHKVRPPQESKREAPSPKPESAKSPTAVTAQHREITPFTEMEIPEIFEDGSIAIWQIQELVAKRYNVDVNEIKSNSHKAFIMLPRQIAYTLARRLTSKGLPTIAKAFGGRDHTTILQGVRKIERRASIDSEFAAELAQLELMVNGQDAVAFPAPLACIE